MKIKLISALCLFVPSLFACTGQRFGLALNQRSFYNPAALCPYCQGSTFFASGMNFFPGTKNEFGNYYAFGNDDNNVLHGPFDFSYATTNSSGTSSKAFSFRYAYAIQFGNWKSAIGMRLSHFSIRETQKNAGLTDEHYKSKLIDADAGLMLTNQKGFYVGVSLNHLGSPEKITTGENGIIHAIGMNQTMNIMSGYVQKINSNWDLLPDLSFSNNKLESVLESGAMIRFIHHFSLGAGVTFASDEKVAYEIRGGFMSSRFKWLTSASQSPEGWNVETGIVWRFWFSSECTGGACTTEPKPWNKKDDFVRHR